MKPALRKWPRRATGIASGCCSFLTAQLATKDEKLAPLVEIAKTLRITKQGSNVILRGTVSLEVIEKLMKNVPQ